MFIEASLHCCAVGRHCLLYKQHAGGQPVFNSEYFNTAGNVKDKLDKLTCVALSAILLA